jgi:FKBP-type peptidyl-prolyl cis-trans isomerase SlyD
MTPEKISNGKLVSLTYSILDKQGNVMEQNDMPVSYVHGGKTELIGGLDQAVEGKVAGDRVEVTVSPQEAFGEHDPALTFTDAIENVPEQFRIVGAEVPMQNDAGETKTFQVTKIENGQLTVDGNHPLAGKTLTVVVRILDVKDAGPGDDEQTGIYSQNRLN